MALLPEPELLRVLTGTGRSQTAVHQEHQRPQEQRAQRDYVPQEEPRTTATTKQSCTGERKQDKVYMFKHKIYFLTLLGQRKTSYANLSAINQNLY